MDLHMMRGHVYISGKDRDKEESETPAGKGLYYFQRDKEAEGPGNFRHATEVDAGKRIRYLRGHDGQKEACVEEVEHGGRKKKCG